MKTQFLASFAALVAILLLIPLTSDAQTSGVSITPDATCLMTSWMSVPGASGIAPSVPAHSAAFRVTFTGAGTAITNITVTRPAGASPAAPSGFAASVDGNSSRFSCDVSDVSVNLYQSDPNNSNCLVLSANGPGTLQVKVTTMSSGVSTVTTKNVVIP